MKRLKPIDYLVLFSLFSTCIFGMIMMYSASSSVAIRNYSYSYDHFFRSQLNIFFLGTLGAIVCMFIPLQIWKKRIVSLLIVVGSILLLFLVLWKGKVVNNAQSWIFGIQPAEFIKLGTVIVMARFFAVRQGLDKPLWYGSGKIMSFFLATFFLICKQPNLGSALLILAIGFSIFLCSGININLLIKKVVLTSIFWGPLLYFLVQYGLSEVQMSRIKTILNPFNDVQGQGYQIVNSFIAIASGGISGRGLGNSIQKHGYLPEPHTDFIMAIISEELGILGVLVILTGILTIVLCSFKIAQNCNDLFGSLIAVGIGSMIGMQSVVNLGGITGLIPLTGTPLPFVSFGGSSLMMNLMSVGILLNISIFNNIKAINFSVKMNT